MGNSPAIGLCGSGIIDAMAQLYLNGLINERGRFQKENTCIQIGEKGPEYILVTAEESGTGMAISIGQEDVNEIQLAKGAIHAGISTLLEITGIPLADVEEIVIAGAFGSFINVTAVMIILKSELHMVNMVR